MYLDIYKLRYSTNFYQNFFFFLVPNLTETNHSEVVDDLSKHINSMIDKLETTQKEHSEIEIKLQSNIDSMRVEKAKVDQDIKIKEKQIDENTSEITKLKKNVEQVIQIIFRAFIHFISMNCYIYIYYFKVKHSAEKLTTLQKLRVDNEMKLNTLKDSFDVDKVKAEINKKKQEKHE